MMTSMIIRALLNVFAAGSARMGLRLPRDAEDADGNVVENMRGNGSISMIMICKLALAGPWTMHLPSSAYTWTT